jgi:hypothetical protein
LANRHARAQIPCEWYAIVGVSPGFWLDECRELNTDGLAREVAWNHGSNAGSLPGSSITSPMI